MVQQISLQDSTKVVTTYTALPVQGSSEYNISNPVECNNIDAISYADTNTQFNFFLKEGKESLSKAKPNILTWVFGFNDKTKRELMVLIEDEELHNEIKKLIDKLKKEAGESNIYKIAENEKNQGKFLELVLDYTSKKYKLTHNFLSGRYVQNVTKEFLSEMEEKMNKR